ncbi:hypothetical protein JTE90_020993 [Oedothorax gibbosus]|uniref:Uncharacterized protein n=1 Tax=Oedothorax gibbosus TaxID=931172 RepID=A0AAV6TXU1_9ARAC|nr:hypothetical protein JTE90_020993 [Oedothorax gibbosus]
MFSKSEIFHRKDYSSYSKLETLSTTSKRSSVHSNIRTILRLASIFGIDVLPAKRTDKNRKSKMVALALYRWFFVCFMLYSLAARLYKAGGQGRSFFPGKREEKKGLVAIDQGADRPGNNVCLHGFRQIIS